jgi:hypothetical protein
MGSFTRQVKTEEGKLEFTFLRVFTTNGVRYYVTVTDNHHKPFLFHMEEQNEEWKIVDDQNIPEWILRVEDQLCGAIIESGEVL